MSRLKYWQSLLPPLAPEPPPPAPEPRKKSRPRANAFPPPKQNEPREPTGPQISRAIRGLKKIWPPDGKPPEGMLIETARGKVNELLADESRRLGLGEISPDTMQRAIDYVRSK